jgi:hypothetical protein
MNFHCCHRKLAASQVKETSFILFSFYLFLFFLASHLCDTNGCISKKHIVLEPIEINQNRKKCQGIILTLCPATATSPPHILKATPCDHGLNHTESNGDNFLFSCRKIQCRYLDPISLDFLNKQK